MTLRGQNTIVYVIWATLVLAALAALFTARWSIAFVAVITLVFSMLPALFVQRFQIKLPVSFFCRDRGIRLCHHLSRRGVRFLRAVPVVG
jgi:predicted neutral ceramidase superfamily lipid hydrolase